MNSYVSCAVTWLSMFTLAACTGCGSKRQKSPTQADTIQGEPLQAKQLPPQARYDGKFTSAVRWSDSNGENLVILSEHWVSEVAHKCKGDERCINREVEEHCEDEDDCHLLDNPHNIVLHAVHYVESDGSLRRAQAISDQLGECEFDAFAGFREFRAFDKASIVVSDKNQNGVGEAAFVYYINCVSGLDPSPQKLVLFEDGAHLIMNGMSLDPEGDDEETIRKAREEYKRYMSFERESEWPAPLKDHASELWMSMF